MTKRLLSRQRRGLVLPALLGCLAALSLIFFVAAVPPPLFLSIIGAVALPAAAAKAQPLFAGLSGIAVGSGVAWLFLPPTRRTPRPPLVASQNFCDLPEQDEGEGAARGDPKPSAEDARSEPSEPAELVEEEDRFFVDLAAIRAAAIAARESPLELAEWPVLSDPVDAELELVDMLWEPNEPDPVGELVRRLAVEIETPLNPDKASAASDAQDAHETLEGLRRKASL